MTGHFKFFALFLGLIISSLRVRRVIIKVPGFFLSPTVLFTIKVTGHCARTHYKFFASPTVVIIKVPGFSSKSDGPFHYKSDRSF